jgi:hypothetical protein
MSTHNSTSGAGGLDASIAFELDFPGVRPLLAFLERSAKHPCRTLVQDLLIPRETLRVSQTNTSHVRLAPQSLETFLTPVTTRV